MKFLIVIVVRSLYNFHNGIITFWCHWMLDYYFHYIFLLVCYKKKVTFMNIETNYCQITSGLMIHYRVHLLYEPCHMTFSFNGNRNRLLWQNLIDNWNIWFNINIKNKFILICKCTKFYYQLFIFITIEKWRHEDSIGRMKMQFSSTETFYFIASLFQWLAQK